ncbi:MAG: CoA transferase subunit A [Geminicoccaceae bacterium]
MSDLNDLAAAIRDGSSLALAPDYSGCSLGVVHALIERGAVGLHLIGVAQLGFQADLLIGAGCVARVESAAVTLGEFGPAPCFTRAIKSGTIRIADSTCPVIHAGLQAAEKGIPFMPLRGILGSDLVENRPDWQIIDNPYGADGDNDPILLVPAIRPDVTLFHARKADRHGNVWIGVRRELMLMAHSAETTLVTVEEITDEDLLEVERDAAGTIPALYIDRVVAAPGGAKPLGMSGIYPKDVDHLQAYAELAKTRDGFESYLRESHLRREVTSGRS